MGLLKLGHFRLSERCLQIHEEGISVPSGVLAPTGFCSLCVLPEEPGARWIWTLPCSSVGAAEQMKGPQRETNIQLPVDHRKACVLMGELQWKLAL